MRLYRLGRGLQRVQIDIAAWYAQPCLAWGHLVSYNLAIYVFPNNTARRIAEAGCRPSGWWYGVAVRDHHRAMANTRRRRRRVPAYRRGYNARDWSPAVPAARLPKPAVPWQENPISGAEGCPSPRVRGDPRIPKARIPDPCAIRKGIPTVAGEVRTPQIAIAWIGTVAAVVVQIAGTVGVPRLVALMAEIAIVIFLLLGIPVVVRSAFIVVRDFQGIVIEQVESGGAVFTEGHRCGTQAQQLDLTAAHCNARLGAVHAGAEARRVP